EQRRALLEHTRNADSNPGASPHHIASVDGRQLALVRIRAVPGQAQRVVENLPRVNVGAVLELCALGHIYQAEKSEGVREFVEEDRDQIDVRSMVRVDSVIPMQTREARGAVGVGPSQTAIELRSDVVGTGSRWPGQKVHIR